MNAEVITYLGEDGEIHEVNAGERVEYLPRLVISNSTSSAYNLESQEEFNVVNSAGKRESLCCDKALCRYH